MSFFSFWYNKLLTDISGFHYLTSFTIAVDIKEGKVSHLQLQGASLSVLEDDSSAVSGTDAVKDPL